MYGLATGGGEGVHESKIEKGGESGKGKRVDTIGQGKEMAYTRRRRTRMVVKSGQACSSQILSICKTQPNFFQILRRRYFLVKMRMRNMR